MNFGAHRDATRYRDRCPGEVREEPDAWADAADVIDDRDADDRDHPHSETQDEVGWDRGQLTEEQGIEKRRDADGPDDRQPAEPRNRIVMNLSRAGHVHGSPTHREARDEGRQTIGEDGRRDGWNEEQERHVERGERLTAAAVRTPLLSRRPGRDGGLVRGGGRHG